MLEDQKEKFISHLLVERSLVHNLGPVYVSSAIVSFSVAKPYKPVLLIPERHRALQDKGDFQMREDQIDSTFPRSPFKN